MNRLISTGMGLIASLLFFYKNGFGMKGIVKTDLPLNKEAKLNNSYLVYPRSAWLRRDFLQQMIYSQTWFITDWKERRLTPVDEPMSGGFSLTNKKTDTLSSVAIWQNFYFLLDFVFFNEMYFL